MDYLADGVGEAEFVAQPETVWIAATRFVGECKATQSISDDPLRHTRTEDLASDEPPGRSLSGRGRRLNNR